MCTHEQSFLPDNVNESHRNFLQDQQQIQGDHIQFYFRLVSAASLVQVAAEREEEEEEDDQ